MCAGPEILLAATAAGAGLQAFGAYNSAKAQRAAYQYNAQLGELKAKDALQRGDVALMQQGLKARQIQGASRAALAANGMDLTQGSALDILTSNDVMAGFDAQIIKSNAEREAAGYRSGAAMDTYAADSIHPNMALASTLLTEGGQVASQWYDFSKRK